MGASKYICYDDASATEKENANIQMNKICSIEELKINQSCSIKLLDDESELESPGHPNYKNLELQKTCSIQLVDLEEYDVLCSVDQNVQPNQFELNQHARYFED